MRDMSRMKAFGNSGRSHWASLWISSNKSWCHLKEKTVGMYISILSSQWLRTHASESLQSKEIMENLILESIERKNLTMKS